MTHDPAAPPEPLTWERLESTSKGMVPLVFRVPEHKGSW